MLQLQTIALYQQVAIKSVHTVLLVKISALQVTLATNRLITSPKVSALLQTLTVLQTTQLQQLALWLKNASTMEVLQHAKLFHAQHQLHLPIVRLTTALPCQQVPKFVPSVPKVHAPLDTHATRTQAQLPWASARKLKHLALLPKPLATWPSLLALRQVM